MAQTGKAKKISRGQLPSKKSIDLATVGAKPARVAISIPLLILIIVAALAIGKFAVLDRLNALSSAKAEVASLEQQLADGYAKIEEYGELTEEYAHYTFADMTEDELTRADRVAVLDMIRRVVIPAADVSAWELKGNELTLTLTSNTLQEINLIAQKIEEEKIVDFCTVTTAATRDSQYRRSEDTDNRVTAKIIVYLNEMEREVTL